MQFDGMFDRIHALVHLDRIEENMKAMAANLAPGVTMIGTVKADGYGHGAVAVAETIDPYVGGFAVAAAEEALELRRHGIKKPILILGVLGDFWYEEMIRNDISMTVFQLDRAKKMAEAAGKVGKKASVHLAVDTGMSRIGMFPTEMSVAEAKEIAKLSKLSIDGLFTHFSRADETDKTAAGEQLEKFLWFRDRLLEEGIEIPLCHCANSAGIMDLTEAHLQAVRAGISIYGLYPSDQVKKERVKLQPAMELKSFISYIKEIPAGAAVSYGGTFVAKAPMRVATIRAGYGDGYPRGLSGKGAVLIHGKFAPILGRVCMDQLMVDVSRIPEAKEGDLVTLLGKDGECEITMEQLAEQSGGFHYELCCLIGKRVPRLYVRDGKVVGTMTAFGGRYEGLETAESLI